MLYIGLDDSKEDIRSLTRTEKSKKIVVHVAFSREKDAREVGGQIRKEFAQYADAQEFGRSWELALSERVQLPVTLNGEVDRLALEGLEDHAAEEELQTEVERQLAEIWSRLLPVRRVGRHQNFFSLGGASLKVMQLLSAVRDRFQKAVTFRQFFAEPTLAGLARLVEMGEASKALPIPAAHSGKGGHPLSRAQRRQWFLYQWAPENPYYTNTMSIRIEGKLNMGALRQSVQAIVNRHEMLRTRFEEMDGKPLQIIEPYTPIQVPLIVVRSSAEAESMIQEEANTPFDLTRDPVIRTQVLRLKARAHILLVSIHHIASDGWSFGVFLDELSQLYEGYAAGGNPTLAELSIQYTDFAAWHEEQIQQGQFEKQMAYWKEVLQGELPVIDLPTDYPRPPQQRFRGKTLEWLLDKEATESVSELSQRNGVSQFMTLLSVYITLLFRYTGKEDLIVGTVIANRNRTEVEPLIGFFVNTLALRVQLANNNPTFQEILARVRDVATGANDHQDLPFEMLLDEMKVERELSRHPLFQTLFVMQQSYETKEANGNRFTMQAESGNTSKFDLSMFVQERDGKLLVQLEYNTDLFAEASMKQLFNHYLNLLQQVVTFPEQPVRGLPYLAETEIGQMQAWNETTRPYADDKCIHKLFEEQAARTPDAEAVVFEDETLTYAELNRRSNQLAHYLHQQGVGPESLVAICMERSVDLIVALLGVLKAGGAYVPLDPSYPPERLAYMLADSGVSVVVTTEKWLDLLSKDGVQTMCLDRDGSALDRFREDNPGAQASSDHVAYLIYTSGSTGHPKGVVIEHRSLLNLVLWHCGAYRVESRDRATLIAGVAFDASGWEIWPYLIKGASLYIPAEETRLMPSRLRDWMIGTGITLSFMPTPLAESMLGLVWPEETKIRYLLTGGDRLGQYAPEGLPFTLVNHYGPTENTVVTTAGTVPSEACEGVPHIGRPIANTQAFVLDDEMQLVPMGVSGELYVGGDGLARGYWNRPELTNEKFIVHPQWDKRLYRTGDLVRWQPEGNLEYLGRIDDQVKIRGYRIELGEIERFLLQMPQVREAVVLTIEDEYGNKKLSAFLSSVNRITMDEVCESLSPYLPTYMIPHHVFMVDSIPVTANGKVDRSALSSRFTSEQSKVYQPSGSPGSKTEMKITEIWLEELKHYVGEIPITANFFEVGGHSLIAGTVLSRIEETLGVSMSLAELFNRPTIKQLAEYVDSALPSRNDFKLQKAEEMQAYPVSSQQRGIYAIMQTDPWTVSYNMPVVFKVDDIQPDRLDKAVQMLLSRHEMLRASFFVEQGQIMYSILNTAEVLVEQLVGDETQWSEIVDGFVRPFTFHQAPIFRVGVIRFPLNYSMIIMDTHHIVADGLSMKLLVEEFINLYVGTHVNEMDGNLAFADYVTLQDKKETIGLEEQRAFWKGFLQGELPVLHLMTDYPRQPYQQLEGDRIRMELNETLVQQIRRAAFEWQVTPYTVFLASYSLLLSYITDQEEIIFGTVFNNRPHRWSQSVGMFINTLPLRISVPTDLTSPEFVAFVHRIVLECHARQDFPMDQMLQGFEIQRDMGRHPLFDTLFVYRHRELDFDREDGPLKTVDYTLRASKFEMTLEIVEKANKTLLELEYCTKLFKPASIQKIAIYYQRILEQMVDSSLMKANQIDPMTDNERREILFTFNDTNMEFTVEEPTVIHWLEKKIAEYPQQIAVKYGNQQITYRELWDKTGQVASYLHDRGIGSKQTVALLTSRSVDMVVSVIGVLRAGASYLPIDPNFPLERIRFMLEDSSAALMLTNINQWKFEFSLLPVEGVFLKDPVILERQPVFTCLQLPDPEEPAYVIYTSGSTGKPKGVMITHGSLMNLLLTVQYKYPTNFGDSYLLKTNYTFDVSIVELLGWCIGDGHLVIAEEETEKDLGAIHENVRRFGITHINFVPSLLKWFCSFCADSPLPSLKYIFVAGEAFPAELTNELIEVFPTAVIENIYGPTECTIYATSHTIKKDESSPVLIGRPLPNQKAYILDSKGRLRPKRFSGELCLSGKGVALGYVNSQANTTSQFVIKDGELLYRTGDLARWLEDGNIEYWGE
ncbi:long-chain-fatty-acid-CoA ligase [Paenibacillus sp. JCM 10914]|nr:long-chain-fatty-acid-CoA ligase [Paenibacillus sp. JCM 10914]